MTSGKVITSLREESSELTVRVVPPSSTVWCTNCLITGKYWLLFCYSIYGSVLLILIIQIWRAQDGLQKSSRLWQNQKCRNWTQGFWSYLPWRSIYQWTLASQNLQVSPELILNLLLQIDFDFRVKKPDEFNRPRIEPKDRLIPRKKSFSSKKVIWLIRTLCSLFSITFCMFSEQ